MVPAPRIWLYSPAAGILEVLVLGAPEVIARHVATVLGGLAGSPDLLNVGAIGLGVHAMLITAQLAPTAQYDAVGTALDVLRYVMPAGAVEWLADPANSMIGVL